MQLLTLVSLSVDSKEVLFSTLTEELQLDIPEIEQLIIDGNNLSHVCLYSNACDVYIYITIGV